MIEGQCRVHNNVISFIYLHLSKSILEFQAYSESSPFPLYLNNKNLIHSTPKLVQEIIIKYLKNTCLFCSLSVLCTYRAEWEQEKTIISGIIRKVPTPPIICYQFSNYSIHNKCSVSVQ